LHERLSDPCSPPHLPRVRSPHLTSPPPACSRSSRLKGSFFGWTWRDSEDAYMLHSLAPSSSTNPRPMTACGLCSRRCFSPRLTAILSLIPYRVSLPLAHRYVWACLRRSGPVRRLLNCFVASCRLCVVDGRCRWGCQWHGGCGCDVCDLGRLRSASAVFTCVCCGCWAVVRADLGSSEVGLVGGQCECL
jgi:hypothetical protein